MITGFDSVISLLKNSSAEVHCVDTAKQLEAFCIFKGNEETCFERCLYLLSGELLPPSPPEGISSLVISFLDRPMPESYQAVNWIVLKKETDLLAVVSSLQTQFSASEPTDTFFNRLLAATNESQSIQKLLDIGHQELKNPLLLVDIALCFVAHSGGTQIVDEPLWDWTLTKGYVTDEYVRYVMSGDEGTPNAQEPSPNTHDSRLIWQEGMLQHRQLVAKVNGSGMPLGYLKLLEYNQPIGAEEAQKLLILSEFIAICMGYCSESHVRENTLVETFLTAMLTQRLFDKAAIEERVSRFQLKLYDNLTVIVLGTKNMMREKVYFIIKRAKNFLTRETMVIFKGNLVILYDHKQPEPFSENELNNFEKLCSDFGVRAGISNTFNEMHSFESFYRQANTALKISEDMNSPQHVSYYNDTSILHMISLFSEHNDPSVLIHPAVFQLRSHDEQFASDFFTTLNEYLRNNQDMALTAVALHIHYNTLKYRMRKLVEVTGLDLTDHSLTFRLYFSFIVYEFLDKSNKLPQ
ncbi:helix-turn-helix domain-containing protein [Oscillospiraceae bacterium MB08-C2-2]|nr:helix-turn-helix domain-containing protein [Oscillospiraceae bacterium MB08-C2-2]